MRIVKPLKLGLLHRVSRFGGDWWLAIGGIIGHSLLQPGDILPEQEVWRRAIPALPQPAMLDQVLPKLRAEVLLGGEAQAPRGAPVPWLHAGFRVGGVVRRFVVSGRRQWRRVNDSDVFDPPIPFTTMPWAAEHAFGGPGHPENPSGRGYLAADILTRGGKVFLPNIERVEQLIRSSTDTPSPALPGIVDLAAPVRQARAGTYDQVWLKTRFPGLPDDADPLIYNLAQPDQHAQGFFRGDEEIELHGMHADHPMLRSSLPGLRMRCFVRFVDDAENAPLTEVPLRIDTVWLFGSSLFAVQIHRGAVPVRDIDGADVAAIMLAYEAMADEPLPLSHYADVLRLRLDPEKGIRYAFKDSQLSPRPSPERSAALDAARAKAKARNAERNRAGQELALRQMGRQLAVPLAQLPDLQQPDPILPEITEEEIEAGEADLSPMFELLAEIQAVQAGAAAETAMLPPDVRALIAASSGHAVPDRDALSSHARDSVDALANAFDPAWIQRKATAQADDADLADLLNEVLSAKPRSADPSAVEANWAAVRARALSLPEGDPLVAEFRKARAAAPAEPDAPDMAAAPAVTDLPPIEPEMEGFLSSLGFDLKATRPAVAPGGEAGPDRDEAERLLSAMRPMDTPRRLSPSPLGPLEPLLPGIPERLGALLRERYAAGEPIAGGDYAGASLAGAAFPGANLRGAFFERANLAGADLSRAVLDDAVFAGGNLAGVNFTGASLQKANLAQAGLEQAVCDGANLQDAVWSEARANGVQLSGARLAKAMAMKNAFTGAVLTGATIEDSIFLETDFQDADFSAARLTRCLFVKCNLTGARFTGASLTRCGLIDIDGTGLMFNGATMDGVGFLKARMEGANFNGVSGRKISLHAAILNRASFAGAGLDEATFSEAELRGADLRQARLRRALFGKAVLSAARLDGADLLEAQLRRADLTQASLRGVNLYGADLAGAILGWADLTDANLRLSILDPNNDGP